MKGVYTLLAAIFLMCCSLTLIVQLNPTETLVIVVENPQGEAIADGDSVITLMDSIVEPYWQWHETQIEYGEYVVVDKYVNSVPSGNGPIWVDTAVVAPVLDSMGKTLSNYVEVIVSLPAGNYGFNGNYVFGKAYINPIDPNAAFAYLLCHELGHRFFPGNGNHSYGQIWKDCSLSPLYWFMGADVMGGWKGYPYKLNPHKQRALGILNEVPISVTETDTVVAWARSMESKTALEYEPNKWIFLLPKVEEVAPSGKNYYTSLIPKIIVQENDYVRYRIDAQEGESYITMDNLQITVGKSAQYYIDLNVDPECVNALGTPDDDSWLVHLIRVPDPCN